tara:strand:+ start:1432 stop:1914 length:483 start_codon:yes stop_codon:yes gene_type:complete
MAFTYAKEDGYIKATETITVAANSTGGNVETSGSSLPCTGHTLILAQADEDTNITAKVQYTMDSGQDVTVGGVGADPSAALSSSSQTWYDAKATEDDAETGVTADNTLEAFIVPKNAQYAKIVMIAANGYGGGSEATELWLDGTHSGIGFSIAGIGADPS